MVFLLLLIANGLLGQNMENIHIMIMNSKDSSYVLGASLYKDGKSLNILNNKNNYSFVSDSFPISIRVKHIGYYDEKLEVKEKGKYIIYMKPVAYLLEQIEVETGYQKIPRERATGAFSFISETELERRFSTDLLDKLEGTLSGVNLDSRLNGQSALIVRGYSSIRSDRTPLIILDGAPYEGSLETLDPTLISSVSILKDAAAASIWGARAGNGVVVITTKVGNRPLGSSVKLLSNWSFGQKPKQYYNQFITETNDFIDFERYLYNEGYFNRFQTNKGYAVFSPVIRLLLDQDQGLLSSDELEGEIERLRLVDIRSEFDRLLYQNSYEQQYSLQVSEVNEVGRHFFSTSWNNNKSFIKENTSQRISILVGSTFKLGSRLKLSPGFQFGKRSVGMNGYTHSSINTGGIYPYAQLVNEEGTSLAMFKDYNPYFLEEQTNTNRLDWFYRPLDERKLNNRTIGDQNLILNFQGDLNITKGLDLALFYNYQNIIDQTDFLYDKESYFVRNLRNRYAYSEGSSIIFPIAEGAIWDKGETSVNSHLGRGQINFIKEWKNSNVSMLAGVEVKQTKSIGDNKRVYGYNKENLTFQNPDFATRLLIFPLNSRATIPSGMSFSEQINRFVSYYYNGSYQYDQKYILSLSARRDASNLFGVNTNQRAVPLWSIGGGWVISEERIWRKDGVVPYLKLRGTIGYSGNVNKTLTRYSTARYGNTLLTGLQSAQIMTPPNEELRWERVRMINTGLDFNVKNSIVSGSVDYYSKKSTDLIGESAIDPTAGFFIADRISFIGNNAEMKSNGADVLINGKFRFGNIRWNPSVILNYNRDEVIKYSGTNTLALFSSSFSAPVEGKPLNAVFSFASAGLDPENGSPRFFFDGETSIDYAKIQANSTFDDLNYHGSSLPIYSGSWINRFQFKHFDLSYTLLYGVGHYIRRSSISYGDLATNWKGHSDYALRWQNPGDEKITNVPALPKIADLNKWGLLYSNSSPLVEKGDYIMLKDIRFSLELGELFPAIGSSLHKAQFYLMINNVGQLWVANKQKIDPLTYEGTHARERFWTCGFNINL